MVSLLSTIYVIAASLLAVYGANAVLLTLIYWRVRNRHPAEPPLTDAPRVTVQLPVYNEMHVVERLIDAAVRLVYPAGRLQLLGPLLRISPVG